MNRGCVSSEEEMKAVNGKTLETARRRKRKTEVAKWM